MTVTTPLIRIRPAPSLEPPTDADRRPDDHPVCTGQLALFAFLHSDSAETWRAGYGQSTLVLARGEGEAETGAVGRLISGAGPGSGTALSGTGPGSGTGRAPGPGRAACPARGPGRARCPARLDPTLAPAAAHDTAAAAGRAAGWPAVVGGSGGRRRPPDDEAGGATQVVADAHTAATRFVTACVEVLNGYRPVGHLRALTTPYDYTSVTSQLTRRAVRLRMPGGRGTERVRMRRVLTCELRTGVAEATAVLDNGKTSWAIALRIERRRGPWLCTLLEVI